VRGWLPFWAFVYALVIIYVSTVLGPVGFHFVPIDPALAWHKLLASSYLADSSDQRPDLIANFLMLVPLGWLTTGAFWLWVRPGRRWLATGVALCCCLCFVIAVKYLQLFFPPRTVSLNYISAQSLGSLCGVALFSVSYGRLSAMMRNLDRSGRQRLTIACTIYAVGLVFYFLFPFDIALSGEELRERAALLPQLLLSLPGAGLPAALRVVIVAAATAVTVPLGVLWALGGNRSLLNIAVAGFVMMSAITVLSLFVLSATPSVLTIVYRTAGIVIGGAAARWLEGQDPGQWRDRLARAVPLMILPYAMAVIFVNKLLSSQWRTLQQALAAFDAHTALPFYSHYMVSKADAAQSVAVQFLIFAPIGVMVVFRRSNRRSQIWTAAVIAFMCSLAIETGRWFKPGLQPDFSNAIIAALSASFAVKLTAFLWRALEGDAVAGPTMIAQAHDNRQGPNLLPRQSVNTASVDEVRNRPTKALVGLCAATICLPLTIALAANYPLAPWALGAALAIYAAALWRWPSLWLLVLPALLPSFDFTLWTGWTLVGEPDLFVLLTIAILALRAPPQRPDFLLDGLPAAAIGLTIVSCLVSLALGLALPGPEGGSDNPYLRPDNALRLAKGFFIALALLPFLRERMRTRADTLVWLGAGMVTGLTLVSGATLTERALFPGLFDFTSDYRVVATFSGMNIGGGYIGAYLAMALPFLLVFMLRPSAGPFCAMFAIAIGAGYALVVTFARTAYAAGLIATLIACSGWAWAGRYRYSSAFSSLVLPAFALVLGGCIIVAALGTGSMAQRLRLLAPDLSTRESNWSGGWALRDGRLSTALFGMGLGTYPRIVLARKPEGSFPTNFVVEHDGGYSFLSLNAQSPTYFGQKVLIEPEAQYRLFLTLRSPDGQGALAVALCEKLLLYSDNCRGAAFVPHNNGVWEDFGVVISSADLDQHPLLGWLARPVDLSFFDPNLRTTIEIGHIRMLDPQGRDILANGDFSRGTERWYFTDDEHRVWRILNQYLMSLFETGVLGLGSLILLVGAAIMGAARAIGRGERMGAAVIGSLAAFLCSSASDHLLAVPRLAALYYIVAFVGLMMLPPRDKQTAAVQ
jgi:VanZ family protein